MHHHLKHILHPHSLLSLDDANSDWQIRPIDPNEPINDFIADQGYSKPGEIRLLWVLVIS
jgi:hypothetical protein